MVNDSSPTVTASARRPKRVPPRTDLDHFAEFVDRAGGSSGADAFSVFAFDGEEERHYRPHEGITEEVFERLGREEWEREELARAVVENLLCQRSHKVRVVRSVLEDHPKASLPEMVEERGFAAVGDEMERAMRAARVSAREPERGPTPPSPSALTMLFDRMTALEAKVATTATSLHSTSRPENTAQYASPYLDTRKAAAYLGVSLGSLYGIVERGQIRPLRGPRRRYRFTAAMLDEYLGRKGGGR